MIDDHEIQKFESIASQEEKFFPMPIEDTAACIFCQTLIEVDETVCQNHVHLAGNEEE